MPIFVPAWKNLQLIHIQHDKAVFNIAVGLQVYGNNSTIPDKYAEKIFTYAYFSKILSNGFISGQKSVFKNTNDKSNIDRQ